ncbi:MAG: ankyrin repeat domain-containing protein [Alphaproteobacteria bacterium]|uniref:Ankyrin repeat domain-containing protein n=1 Tax=Candidatus Nitrobium versatile TaxID=2884831 RepID=A0A953J982_9BACT|nr:ankyrin repeat domain-containing protein [Candidatus Nitrobium versatile]
MEKTEFLKAAGKGDYTVVHKMLAQGIDADTHEEGGRGRTAMMRACRHGHTDIVRLLLEKGADVNKQDAFGDTALTYAACNGYMDIVKLLLEHGAGTEIRNNAGRTVLEEVGAELLCGPSLTDEELSEAQKQYWDIITMCRQHTRQQGT